MVLTNYADGFRVPQNLTMITGVWPLENKTWVYKTKTVISWLAMLSLSITMLMEFFTNIHDLSKVSQILYIMVSFLSAIAKNAAFCYYGKTFIKLLNHLKDPSFTSYPEGLDYHMEKTVKRTTILANIYMYLVGCCVILMGIFPILDNKDLPFPFPYDCGSYRFLMYAFQLFCLSISACNNSSLDLICISIMGITSAQLNILMQKIRFLEAEKDHCDEIVANNDDELVLVKLKQCVNHHLAIIELIEYTEKIFNIGIFAQFLASGIVICNVLFHFVLIPLSIQSVMLVNYLIIVLIQLFIYCWYGNKVITKTNQITNACYSFKWYDYGTSVRQYVFLIMERSKKPLSITALRFSSVSIKSFTSILRWSYSLLTLLLQMYKK